MQDQHHTDRGETGEINLHMLDYWRVIRVRLPLIILVFLLVVITAGVATYMTPRQYQSSVTMQVKEDNNNMHIFGADGSQQTPDALNIRQSIGHDQPPSASQGGKRARPGKHWGD